MSILNGFWGGEMLLGGYPRSAPLYESLDVYGTWIYMYMYVHVYVHVYNLYGILHIVCPCIPNMHTEWVSYISLGKNTSREC